MTHVNDISYNPWKFAHSLKELAHGIDIVHRRYLGDLGFRQGVELIHRLWHRVVSVAVRRLGAGAARGFISLLVTSNSLGLQQLEVVH